MIKRFASASAIVTLLLSVPVVDSAGVAVATTVPSTSWRPIYHTHFATNTFMEGVTAVGAKHAWAVGYDYPRGFVLSWNGKTWRPMKALPHGDLPMAVAASSPANVWVFSETANGAQASRWNGHRWLRVPMPAEDIGVGAAAVSSATDVWYSDGQQLLHWNGHRWSTEITPAPVGVASGPGGQVWEALAGRAGDHRSRLIVRRWNGRSWISVRVPHIPVIADARDSLSIASARNIAILTAMSKKGRPVKRGVFWAAGRWKVVALPWFQAGGSGLAAAGRRLTWASPRALFTGRQWLPGPLTVGAIAMAGVPGTSATWAVGKSDTGAHPTAGWIWLNGKL